MVIIFIYYLYKNANNFYLLSLNASKYC